MLLTSETGTLPADLPPPPAIRDTDSLFLDFDGTLIELAATPDAVIVSEELPGLLTALGARRGGRVAIVTGRAIAQIDLLLGGVAGSIAIAGSHGAERRTPDGIHIHPEISPALAQATASIEAFAAAREGLVWERKPFGVGLHYRLAPEHGPEAIAFAARIARDHGLTMQPGKMMAEVRLAGNKGEAVRALLAAPPFVGTTPIFFGDDVTDEDGFSAAAEQGGAGVLIGARRPTAALYRLEDVTALHEWLARAVAIAA